MKSEYEGGLRRRALDSLICALLAATPSAFAQQALPDPSVELRRQQDNEAARRALAMPTDRLAPKDLRAEEGERLPEGESPCFDIKDLRLVGPDAAAFNWALKDLAGPQGDDPPQGRCLGVQGINLVQKRLQNAIMARGYVTTRVVVENQNIASGVLSFHPIGGRLAQVVVPESAREHIHAATALPADPGDLLNLRDVEQALENLQRVPTVQADLQIAPGQEAGLSDLQLNWTQDRRWRLGVSLDDAGSDSTGQFQGTTTASADNLLGLSDLAYVSFTRGFGGGEGPSPKGSQALAAHYSVPWGYWLYSLNLSRHHYHQTVVGAFDNYRYSGESDHIELNVDRVLWRNNRHVTTAHASLQRRTSNNFIDDTEVLVQRRAVASLVWGLSHRMYWGPVILAGDVTFKQGLSGLGTLPAPEEAFDEGTSRYRLTTASLNAQVPWKALGDAWRYSATVRLQKHHTRLTPQDRFSIGGRYTVRGFDNEASLVAESGVVWRNELNWSPSWALGQSPYLGWDMGRVSGPSAANLPGTTLVGAVLGVRGLLGGFQYDCFWGKPISKPAELKASSSTWGFMLHRGF